MKVSPWMEGQFSPGRSLAIFLLLMALITGSTYAQTVSGTLSGRITDTSGGTVPGVTVIAVEDETQAKRQTMTNEVGFYQIPFAPIGRYTVTFALPGFKTLVRPAIEITLNNTTTLTVTLEVAAQHEVITVTADTPQIDTTGGELKTSFNAQHVMDKPIFDRNMLALAADVPGFQTNPVNGQNNPTASSGSSVQINGTGTRAATFQTDGVNNDDSSENQNRQNVNISSIKEFQILRNSFSAEFGRGAGAVVLVQTKNGTNAFHGDAYWYTRNSLFNAQSYFGNLAGSPKSTIHRHLYGGTLGGPIHKDKLFFFQSIERTIDKGAGLVFRDILLPNERTPDPSVTNPADRAWIQGIIDRYPNVLPNFGSRTYVTLRGRNYPSQDYSTRIDLPAKANHYFTFRYQFSGQVFDNEDNLVRGEATQQNNRQQNFGSTYTHVFTPKTVGEFRWAVGRRRTTVNIKDGNDTPIVRIGGYSYGTTLGNSGVFPIFRFQTDFQYVYNLTTMLTPRNSLKVGADVRKQQLNDRADQYSRGFWSFGAAQGQSGIQNFLRGYVSSFTKSWGPNFLGNRMGEMNVYVQDDWKLRPNLTLNFGARLERVLKLKEVNHLVDYGFGTDTYIEPRMGFAWSPGKADGILRKILGGPGNFVLRGGGGFYHGRLFQSAFSQNGASIRFNPPNALSQSYSQPDIGGPADPTRDFVFIPGSFPATRYSPTFVDPGLRMPYTEQWNLTLERQFPHRTSLSISYTGNRGIGLLLYDLTNRAEFPIQAPNDPRVSVGNRGVMIDRIIPPPGPQPNPDAPNYEELLQQWNQRNSLYTSPPPGAISLGNLRTNDRRPDPRYSGVLHVINGSWSYYHGLQVSVVKAYSRGLALNANYTWSKAIDTGSELTFTGLDLGASPNGKNSAAALHGLSLFHQKQRVVINYSYNLPFFARANPILRSLLGGWQVAGTTSFSTGNPFTIRAGYDLNGDGNDGDRPNLVNPAILGVSIDNGRNDPRFPCDPRDSRSSPNCRQISQSVIRPTDIFPNATSTERIFLPGSGFQGSLGRNTFFVHGQNNTDFQVSKGFRLREGHQFLIRMEFYNFFNRVQWDYPQRDALSIERTFLRISDQRNSPRTGQFVLRYVF
ncbi:MAG: TonB-dependent receptor [Acidobacteria bacterium]|nr:TonB-dependent receptor [Acidobacteriota bacterium]MBI3657477.1 TonB-dependent receptor [Acidobacteriota bacterium]